MLDFFKVVTVNHKKLKTEDLEHFVLRYENNDDLAGQLRIILEKTGQEEVVYLNTCNRIIFFFYGPHLLTEDEGVKLFAELNPDLAGYNSDTLAKVIEIHEGIDAMRHIYEVASSLDSMVVGEREIFRQFRNAYNKCFELGLTGDHLRLAEKCTVKAAKDVYTNTEIGRKPVSVVSLVMQRFMDAGLPKDAGILLVGAGETNASVGRFLNKHGFNNITIFNRSLDNAMALSSAIGAKAFHLEELRGYSGGMDCLIACTNAQEIIVDLSMYESLNPHHNQKVLIDLSIPRNISENVASQDEVTYIDIESIRDEASENLKFRSGNIASARVILNRHLEEFIALYNRRKMEKAFKKLPVEIEKIKERALTEVYRNQIDELPEQTKDLIEEIVNYMQKKCVAVPMKMARESIQEQMK